MIDSVWRNRGMVGIRSLHTRIPPSKPNTIEQIFYLYPVKNVTRILSYLFDGSLVENDIKSDGNPIIFLANAMEIP